MEMKCKLNNIEVNYEVYGEGKPILMLHGSPVDHRLMKGCMEPVFSNKSGYKRIYIDLPGMGKTKGERWITSLDAMLEVVIHFIEKIIKDENFLLVGESFGGYLSRGVLHKIGDRVDGMLLICPAIFLDEKKRNIPAHVILKKDDKLLSQLDFEDAEKFKAIQVVQNKINWERFRDEILCSIKIADIEFLESIDANGYDFSFNVDNMDIKFNKPCLIILGRQDSRVGYKDAWRILEKYPRATFAVLDRAGHNLQIEQAELFNNLVNEWLDRIKE